MPYRPLHTELSSTTIGTSPGSTPSAPFDLARPWLYTLGFPPFHPGTSRRSIIRYATTVYQAEKEEKEHLELEEKREQVVAPALRLM